MGIPGKSNAFAISRKLGLPEHLIENASAFIGKQEKDFEDVIAELDASREALAKEQEETARYREEAKRLKERLQTRQEQFDKRREEMLGKAREDVRSPKTGIMGSCETLCGCWARNPNLLQEQTVLLTSEPSLQLCLL